METQSLQGLLLLEVSSQDNGNLVCISTELITMFSGMTRHHTLCAYCWYRPIQVPLAVHKSSHTNLGRESTAWRGGVVRTSKQFS